MDWLRRHDVYRWVIGLMLLGGLARAIGSEMLAEPTMISKVAGDEPIDVESLFMLFAAGGEIDPKVIVATVNGQPISDRKVQRQITLALRGHQLSPQETQQARLEMMRPTLELLIEQRALFDALKQEKLTASSDDVDAAVAAKKKELRNVSIEEFLMREGISLEEFREELQWQITWQKVLDRELTEAAVANYFDAHRREFDGTQLRASHILLALDSNANSGTREKVAAHAAVLHQQIAAGKLLFSDVARDESIAPSKDQGGDIGFIARHGDQHEAFAAAAFALEKGDVSQPVVTPHGVHLIRWTDSKPGKLTLAQVRDSVRQAAATELFRRKAGKAHEKATIKFIRN